MRTTGVRCILAGVAMLLSAFAVSQAQQPLPGKSGLSGVVIDGLDAPVAFAQVLVVDGNNGVTADEDGRFLLNGVHAGKILIEVRRIGFDPVYFDIEMPEASVVDVRVRMHQNVRELSTVSVNEVQDPLRRVGFYERMAAGNGHFLSPEMIERMRPVRATDAFMSIPNLVVDRRGNKSRVMASNFRCEYAMVIDRVLVGEAGSRVRTTSPDDLVSASDLYAVEVYPRNRGLPSQFLGLMHEDGCGTIVIWTKGMLPR